MITRIKPLDKLVAIWSDIDSSLRNHDINETILFFRRPYSTTHKRRMNHHDKTIQISQFSNSESESRKFTSIIIILKLLIANIAQNKRTTKRDIYYQDVALFKKNQRYSNELIDLIAYSLDLSSEIDLMIYASQKGLIYGSISLLINNSQLLDLNYSQEPLLIPFVNDKDNIRASSYSQYPAAIVVLEKDAAFRCFCNYIKQKETSLNLIVITGKGFPDKLTKKFVSLLADSFPKSPILGFMDSDVYGLSICKNYKLGTIKETTYLCPRMILSGVFLLEYDTGWLDLSKRDIRMMVNFVKELKERTTESSNEKLKEEFGKWHRELTRGLVLFKKSEMNAMNQELALPNYLLRKVCSHLQ